MSNIHNVSFNERNRFIEISYKIEDDESDSIIFHEILEISRKYRLTCTVSQDYNNLRFFHISGIGLLDLQHAYELMADFLK